MTFIENNRKVTMGLLTIAVGVAVEILSPKGLTDNVKQLLEFVSIGFFLSNGVSHIAGAIKGKVEEPAPLPDDSAKELEALKQQNEILAQGVNNIQQILQTVLRR